MMGKRGITAGTILLAVLLVAGCDGREPIPDGTGTAEGGTKQATQEASVPDENMPEAFRGICEDVLFGEDAKAWSELSREIVNGSPSAYPGFEICSIYRDGKWIKSLYNEEKGIVFCEEAHPRSYGKRIYTLYKDGQTLSLAGYRGITESGYFDMYFIDVDQDGEEELLIWDSGWGWEMTASYVVKLDNLRAIATDFTIEEFAERFFAEDSYHVKEKNGVQTFIFTFEDREGKTLEGRILLTEQSLTFRDISEEGFSGKLFTHFRAGLGEEPYREYVGLEAEIFYDAALDRYVLGDTATISWGFSADGNIIHLTAKDGKE